MKKHLSFITLIFTTLVVAISPASATQDELSLPASAGTPWASDADIDDAFGQVNFSIGNCESPRTVRIEIWRYKLGPMYTRAVAEITRRAIPFWWQECIGTTSPANPALLDSASVYLRSGEEVYRVYNLKTYVADAGPIGIVNPLGPSPPQVLKYEWGDIDNLLGIRLGRERIAAEQAWESAFWGWVQFILFCGLLVWLFTKRDIVLGWFYYLSSPSTDNIAGTTMPTLSGRIENRIRARQARSDAKFEEAQEELVKATNEHELAKARLAALRKRIG